MKIAINEEIIDTCNIYRIGKIVDGGSFALFEIESLNKKSINVVVRADNNTLDVHPDKLAKLISVRNDIINIWSENQLTIPQFNLK